MGDDPRNRGDWGGTEEFGRWAANPETPSNVELAERLARVEEQVDHVAEGVESIEEKLDDQMEEVKGRAEENAETVGKVRTAATVVKWGVPATAAVLSAIAGLAATGAVP